MIIKGTLRNLADDGRSAPAKVTSRPLLQGLRNLGLWLLKG